MPTTYGDVVGTVRLHCPDAPNLLVRNWVQSTYARLYHYRPWTWTWAPGQIVWEDARDLAEVTVTFGSTQVTSTALFLAADVGRQFRVGTFPIYTVARFINTSTIELDQPFQGTEEGAVDDAEICDAWTTMPANFGSFLAIVDQVTQRWIPWWMTNEELDLLDPTRTSGGNPRVLATLSLSTQEATLGQQMYSLWPLPSEAGSFQYYMRTAPDELADDSVFKGVLARRPDVLETGALAQAAKWPGTAQRPNPYFNLALASSLETEFMQLLFQLDIRDDDINPLSIDKIPWQRWTAWTWAYNTQYLQMTDATLGAYWGQDGWYPNW